uniref:Urea transporter n=1 Tax=Callorhinchus milii TaxID=7868 RepID=A0A4W3IXZ5_CALMI|eukprot:gi/632959044/ref/XP_007895391.1/ PREDICTED: urea transporter 1-like [Callorhinchus milii]
MKDTVGKRLIYFTGNMKEFGKWIQAQPFGVQLLEWNLRGVSQVIFVNNPLSGMTILMALILQSPWVALTGAVGLLSSTLTSLILSQDSEDIAAGRHGYNGMLVGILIALFSDKGDWYWWLLIPSCLMAASCTFIFSGLKSLFEPWDLPVLAFPFNTMLILYSGATGRNNQHFPQVHIGPQTTPTNVTAPELNVLMLLRAIPIGAGQIYGCDNFWPSVIILMAVFLSSPILCAHVIVGSAVGIAAGLSLGVPFELLYNGLATFNGVLACMTIGGLFYVLTWQTHLLAIACAFFSSYSDQAFRNVLAMVGLPAASWASTLTITLFLLGKNKQPKMYKLPISTVSYPEESRKLYLQWSKPQSNETNV